MLDLKNKLQCILASNLGLPDKSLMQCKEQKIYRCTLAAKYRILLTLQSCYNNLQVAVVCQCSDALAKAGLEITAF